MAKKHAIRGYTLVEIVAAVTTVSIIAATIAYNAKDMVIEKRAEQSVIGFWSEMVSLRSTAMKNDEEFRMVLIQGSNTFKIQRMVNGVPVDTVLSYFNPSAFRITFGKTTGANNLPSSMYGPGASNVVNGGWADDTIRFQNDEMGTIENGALYLQNSGVPEVGYAIVKNSTSNMVKLYKWNRTSWYEM